MHWKYQSNRILQTLPLLASSFYLGRLLEATFKGNNITEIQ